MCLTALLVTAALAADPSAMALYSQLPMPPASAAEAKSRCGKDSTDTALKTFSTQLDAQVKKLGEAHAKDPRGTQMTREDAKLIPEVQKAMQAGDASSLMAIEQCFDEALANERKVDDRRSQSEASCPVHHQGEGDWKDAGCMKSAQEAWASGLRQTADSFLSKVNGRYRDAVNKAKLADTQRDVVAQKVAASPPTGMIHSQAQALESAIYQDLGGLSQKAGRACVRAAELYFRAGPERGK